MAQIVQDVMAIMILVVLMAALFAATRPMGEWNDD